MRSIRLAIAMLIVGATALVLAPTPDKASRYGTTLGATDVSAQVIVPPRPRPDPACSRVCLTGLNGTRYCASGQVGQKGCKSIVNNNCIFTICPL